MYFRRPAGGDEWLGKVAREGRGYLCGRHDMMMIIREYQLWKFNALDQFISFPCIHQFILNTDKSIFISYNLEILERWFKENCFLWFLKACCFYLWKTFGKKKILTAMINFDVDVPGIYFHIYSLVHSFLFQRVVLKNAMLYYNQHWISQKISHTSQSPALPVSGNTFS